MELVEEKLPFKYKQVTLKIPYDEHNIVSYFMENYNITKIEHKEDGSYIDLTINEIDYEKYKDYIY